MRADGGVGDAPLVGAAGRKAPFIRPPVGVARVDLQHLRGAFDRHFFGTGEIGEDIVARPMPADTPFDRMAALAHRAAHAHHAVEIRHLEGDMVERRPHRHTANDERMMVDVAIEEAVRLRLVDDPEAEYLRHVGAHRVVGAAVQVEMGDLRHPVFLCRTRR